MSNCFKCRFLDDEVVPETTFGTEIHAERMELWKPRPHGQSPEKAFVYAEPGCVLDDIEPPNTTTGGSR